MPLTALSVVRSPEMSPRSKTLSSLLFILSLLWSSVYADTYRWVDESGTVVYSQLPPPDSRPASVIAPPSPPAEDPEAIQQRLDAVTKKLEQSAREREKLKRQQAQEKQRATQRKKNCEAARRNLETITSRPPNTLYRIGDNEYKRFTVEELNKRISDIKKIIKENCN